MPQMTVKKVRGAFLAIFAPKAFGEQDPAYGGKFVVPKDHPQVKDLDAAMLAAAKEKWGEKGPAILAKLIEEDRVCFHKKTYTNKNGDPVDGFEDAYYISARNGGDSPTKPSAFTAANVKLDEPAGLIYSGAFFDTSIDIYAQDNKYGRRINASLRGVRFADKGEAFGGGVAAGADEFGAPAEGAEDFV